MNVCHIFIIYVNVCLHLMFCRGSGQVCSATSRVLLHKDIKSIVVKRLIERVAVIRIGDSLDPSMVNETGPTMGPVVNQVQYDKILVRIVFLQYKWYMHAHFLFYIWDYRRISTRQNAILE